MGISIKAYARHRGVSPAAVRKALEYGRITKQADGTIDPVRADRDWAANTLPRDGEGKGAVPVEALDAVHAVLPDLADIDLQGMTLVEIRTANEILKVHERKLKLEKLRGGLIDRNKALAMALSLARQTRDAWANWPVRVAVSMANELGVDVHAAEIWLDKHVRAHLAEMAEIEINL